MKAFTYIPPGIVAEIVISAGNKKVNNDIIADIVAAAFANVSGAISSFLLFFGKNAEGLYITIMISAISGGIGGAIANMVIRALESKIVSFKKS